MPMRSYNFLEGEAGVRLSDSNEIKYMRLEVLLTSLECLRRQVEPSQLHQRILPVNLALRLLRPLSLLLRPQARKPTKVVPIPRQTPYQSFLGRSSGQLHDDKGQAAFGGDDYAGNHWDEPWRL
ncbi:uncharacterized protein MELLADRAFT_101833 [Melampsora larici-populina 98AG31]|uniref:Uncharacterized protein n=1 Tax=Melampsora larici-populina (strain 98AG31 / pathotype 3-4-7) TaxID=747676 RepID=F4R521_MELLP|nr:uncharacterized protein MELLADRAFT_101833 [Melampsora larici-populina 98AG31]EGG12349.1 hypothetical protein MELLADRAFT_101833 [Melampsora larici-populina 98AG31]